MRSLERSMETSHIILCADIEKTSAFFYSTFKFEEVVKDIQHPFPHASILITKDIRLILVQKSQCDADLLKSLLSVAITRVMAAVEDPNRIRDNALAAGAATIETLSDELGGKDWLIYSHHVNSDI